MDLDKRLKVLFFPAWFPTPKNELAGIFIKEHAKALGSLADVAIFHVYSDSQLESILKFEFQIERELQIYRISHKKFSTPALFPLNVCLYLFATVYGYIKTYRLFGKADINHVHILTRTGILPFFLSFLCKTPYVISEHWSRYLPISATYNGFLRKLLTQIIVKYSSGLSTVSEDLKIALGNHLLTHKNFVLINNTINSNIFSINEKETKSRRFKFLHVSGLQDKIKNVSGIIKAAAILLNEKLDFELHIVGDDPDRKFLEELAINLNVNRNIFFHGKLFGYNLIEQYQTSDAFILFSNFENQPCVLIESLICGLPVIATKVGGVPEFINEKNGILIDPKNNLMLVEAMRDFLSSLVSFDRQKIRDHAVSKFGYQNVSHVIFDFYKSAQNLN